MDVSEQHSIVGTGQYDSLRGLIEQESSGMIAHVDQDVQSSSTIWNVELPAALRAFDRGRYFLIPLFRNTGPSVVAEWGLTGTRLAVLGGIVIPSNLAVNDPEISPLHRQLASDALRMMLKLSDQEDNGEPALVRVRTRDGGVPGSSDETLLLDWEHDYRDLEAGGPGTPDSKQAAFDVRSALASMNMGAIRLAGPGHLSAALLLGYVFHRSTGFSLEADQRGHVWAADGVLGEMRASVAAQQLSPRDDDIELVLAVSRGEVVADADAAVRRLGLPIGGRMVVEPVGGPSRTAIASAADARRFTHAVIDALTEARTNWGCRGAIHIFIAAPFALAALIGHSLNGFTPLKLYERRSGGEFYQSFELD